MFDDFDETFGNRDLLGLVHLNDSAEPFESKKDRHGRIGRGHIWNDTNLSVLTRLLDKIEERGIPTTLETTEHDYSIIQAL